ncbi:chlorophyll a/b-binding protein domain-containing protein [Pavlovales sp. CCMP2436]|nr:chlorophyll a/b-binding protein domain-containing protein [Pavlovales sp. CCMP2436]|mmetsp:Transcript_21454/g.54415  ORF Transcript_21454/g.54415 Transcript_21454/m.54415 type:complete len:245 (+) Transcript_21454:59-793(+)
MFKQILLAAALLASADAMAGRPKISSGSNVKGGTAPLFGPSSAKAKAGGQLSASIPFAPQPEKLDGTMLGDIGFDPLGLSNLWDLNWLRAAEIKHGRVGMLASLGFLTQEAYRLPGPASNPGMFAAGKAPIEALVAAPPLAIAQIVFVIFLIELATASRLFDTEAFFEGETAKNAPAGSGNAGDLGWDPLGLSADGLNLDYAIAELKHGRLAMLGAAGMLAGCLVSPGQTIAQQTYAWVGLPYN